MRVPTHRTSCRRADAFCFQLIYLATLPAFLVKAMAARLTSAGRVGRLSGSASGLTVLGEAKAAARTCGAFALMG